MVTRHLPLKSHVARGFFELLTSRTDRFFGRPYRIAKLPANPNKNICFTQVTLSLRELAVL